MAKTTHIMSGGSTLLGIALGMVAGLKITGSDTKTLADEIAGAGALLLAIACALSYLSIRAEPHGDAWEKRADIVFMLGLVIFIASVGVLATSTLH